MDGAGRADVQKPAGGRDVAITHRIHIDKDHIVKLKPLYLLDFGHLDPCGEREVLILHQPQA